MDLSSPLPRSQNRDRIIPAKTLPAENKEDGRKKWDRMKEDCQTSGMGPNRRNEYSYPAANMLYSSGKGKGRNSEIHHPGYNSRRPEAASSVNLKGRVLSESCQGGALWS